MEKEEKKIVFGNAKTWVDVEADEATFDKRDISEVPHLRHLIVKPKDTIMWEQWAGIIQRGKPHTLVLGKLSPKLTRTRAPGPGAIRKTEWKTIANQILVNRKVVLHTDSAKSYKLKMPGVIHDRVVHCKKRIKVNGVYRWTSPKYVNLVTHNIPGTKKKLRVISGTQIVDRAWRFLKDRLKINQNTKAGTRALKAKLRSAQYDYWMKNSDLWLATGDLCSEALKKCYPEAC